MGSPSAYERDSAYYPPSPERTRSAPGFTPVSSKPSAGYLSRKSLLVDSLKIAAGNRSSTDFDQFVLPPPGPTPELVPPDDDDLVVLCASIFFELGVTDFSKGVGDDYLLCALEHIAGGTTGARKWARKLVEWLTETAVEVDGRRMSWEPSSRRGSTESAAGALDTDHPGVSIVRSHCKDMEAWKLRKAGTLMSVEGLQWYGCKYVWRLRVPEDNEHIDGLQPSGSISTPGSRRGSEEEKPDHDRGGFSSSRPDHDKPGTEKAVAWSTTVPTPGTEKSVATEKSSGTATETSVVSTQKEEAKLAAALRHEHNSHVREILYKPMLMSKTFSKLKCCPIPGPHSSIETEPRSATEAPRNSAVLGGGGNFHTLCRCRRNIFFFGDPTALRPDGQPVMQADTAHSIGFLTFMRLMKEFLVLNPVHVPADFVEQSRNGVLDAAPLARQLAGAAVSGAHGDASLPDLRGSGRRPRPDGGDHRQEDADEPVPRVSRLHRGGERAAKAAPAFVRIRQQGQVRVDEDEDEESAGASSSGSPSSSFTRCCGSRRGCCRCAGSTARCRRRRRPPSRKRSSPSSARCSSSG